MFTLTNGLLAALYTIFLSVLARLVWLGLEHASVRVGTVRRHMSSKRKLRVFFVATLPLRQLIGYYAAQIVLALAFLVVFAVNLIGLAIILAEFYANSAPPRVPIQIKICATGFSVLAGIFAAAAFNKLSAVTDVYDMSIQLHRLRQGKAEELRSAESGESSESESDKT
jgi:hypothetical protein